MTNDCECGHATDMHNEEGFNEDRGFFYAGMCCVPACECLAFEEAALQEQQLG